jgi:hypothetical protein
MIHSWGPSVVSKFYFQNDGMISLSPHEFIIHPIRKVCLSI